MTTSISCLMIYGHVLNEARYPLGTRCPGIEKHMVITAINKVNLHTFIISGKTPEDFTTHGYSPLQTVPLIEVSSPAFKVLYSIN